MSVDDTLKEHGTVVQLPRSPCLSIADWCNRDIPDPDFLLGEFLSTTSRIEIAAFTGLGKTNFALQMAFSMADGKDFLHWRGVRKSKVLYIDGEMSRRLMARRIKDAAWRHGGKPETLSVLSLDDDRDMAPLNTEKGQEAVNTYIRKLGGVDFIWFDNVQALIQGSMIEEEPWQQTLPWIRDLTSRSVGQAWIHHTGQDKSRSYGTTTREWQLDTVLILEPVENPTTDIAFTLKFQKARERSPQNRSDFSEAVVTLSKETWAVELSDTRPKSITLTTAEKGWLRDLTGLFAEPGAPIEIICPASGLTQQNCLSRDHLRDRFKQKGKFTLDTDGKLTGADRQKMSAALNALKDKGKIAMTDKHVWLLLERQ